MSLYIHNQLLKDFFVQLNSQGDLQIYINTSSYPLKLTMFQPLNNQQTPSTPSLFSSICNALQNWIAKEIIDFDPFDDELIVAQGLIEQFRQTQITIKAQ
jgi:hypothetical protein